MRLHVAFAVLASGLVLVTAWVLWSDAFPEWRAYQRDGVRRDVARLEVELQRERAAVARPELRYRVAQLKRAISLAGSGGAARTRAEAELGGLERQVDGLRALQRAAETRLAEPRALRERQALAIRLEIFQTAYARATGEWPPDTARLGRLWIARDSVARLLFAIEGPAQQLRDSLRATESRAADRRAEAARLASSRDSLEAALAKLMEPVTRRERALRELERHAYRVREIASADGQEVARCPTCHGALDDFPSHHPALPSQETFREIPCTACHLGHGRALRARDAHRGMVAAGDFGAGPFSLRGRIARLASPDPAIRARAREELWQITRSDPGAESDAVPAGGDPDSAAAAVWADWWKRSSPFFEPGEDPNQAARGGTPGIDRWTLSARGRPLRYVGSRRCLACHETLHREHSREWMATKFRSIERLVGERDPRPCLPCHSTGYDPATGRYAEPGVTCEACHGPGERYNEMMVAGQELIGKGDEARGRTLLAESARLAREAASLRTVPGDAGPLGACVACHHPRRHRDRGPSILDRDPRGPGVTKSATAPVGGGAP